MTFLSAAGAVGAAVAAEYAGAVGMRMRIGKLVEMTDYSSADSESHFEKC